MPHYNSVRFVADEAGLLPFVDVLAQAIVNWFLHTTQVQSTFVKAQNVPVLLMLLNGDVGAGKTTLVRMLGGALGAQERVSSPTYTLINTHATTHCQLVHGDLYRVNHPSEIGELHLFDVDVPTLIVLEWAMPFAQYLPQASVLVDITDDGSPASRIYTISSPDDTVALQSFAHELQIT